MNKEEIIPDGLLILERRKEVLEKELETIERKITEWRNKYE